MRNHQFGLGSLLYTVTVFAIAFALLGPAIRAIGNEGRWGLLGTSALQFGLFAIVVSRTITRRNKALAEAGQSVYRSSVGFRSSNDLVAILQSFIRIVPLIVLQLLYLSINAGPAMMLALMINPWGFVMQAAALGLAAEAAVSMHLEIDQRGVEIYERGYIYHGFYFQPWDQVTAIRAAKHSPNRILVSTNDQGLGDVVQTVKTRSSQRAENVRQMTAFWEASPVSSRPKLPRAS